MRRWCCLLLIVFLTAPATALGAGEGAPGPGLMAFSPEKPAPVPARPWRVIYVEGGPYRDYHLTLAGLARGLKTLGLIDRGEVPVVRGSEDTTEVWNWLAENAGGPYLKFLPDGHYSAGWDETRRAAIKREVLARLARGEVDLILAFGTSAGEDLATNEHRTTVLSVSVTDPVAAGLTRSEGDSGLDHVHVQVEVGKIERQLTMFHKLFRFQRLGVPYDSSPGGQKTLGVRTIEQVARERGFEIVPCLAELEIPDREESFQNLLGCLEFLSRRSEAVYLTVNNGMQADRMDRLLAPLIKAGLPTFSQNGPAETRLGVLMSLAEDDFARSGLFEAEVVRELLRGRKPREISQIYVAPLTLALNLKMALAIGWNPPFEVLAAVDELYDQIMGQE